MVVRFANRFRAGGGRTRVVVLAAVVLAVAVIMVITVVVTSREPAHSGRPAGPAAR